MLTYTDISDCTKYVFVELQKFPTECAWMPCFGMMPSMSIQRVVQSLKETQLCEILQIPTCLLKLLSSFVIQSTQSKSYVLILTFYIYCACSM